MKTTLPNLLDAKSVYPIGFDPAHTTPWYTPWYTPGTDISSCLRLGLTAPAYAPYQQDSTKGCANKVTFFDAEDEVTPFEPIPSVQEKGYYGARKLELLPSAPTVPPIAFLKPAKDHRKPLKAAPAKSVLTYFAEMGKYTTEVSHAHVELTNDAVRRLMAMISNLTVSTAIRKDKWEARLDELHTFVRGWDSYDAEPPSAQSIGNARVFMTFLRTVAKEPAALNPSAVGGVGFTFRGGQRSVYIEFRNTGNAHAAFMGAGKPRVEKVTQSTDGFRAVMHQVEKHLYEQDAAAARSDEALVSASH